MSKSKSAKFDWLKVGICDSDQCWPWTGSVNAYGYGDCVWIGRRSNASRAAFESVSFFIGNSLQVCHTCDNPICCNPSHLYEGTNKQNSMDRKERGRIRGDFKSGDKHPRHSAKINEDLVRKIRIRNSEGVSQSQLARDHGLSSMQVSKICRRVAWAHIE